VILRSAQSETRENEVAAGDIVPAPGTRFEETLESASPDLLREMIKGFAQRMMDAEVEVRCNAGYGEVTPERVNSRNGYRRGEWDTRAGTVELAIPKLRESLYFPSVPGAPAAGRARAGLGGRDQLPAGCVDPAGGQARCGAGGDGLSKSQVSLMAAELDQVVEGFRSRPLARTRSCGSTR
jgi:putative transposase